MNKKKFHKLCEAARKEQSPEPPPGFDADVMRAVLQERPDSGAEAVSLFEALGALFPRLALASALIIVACVLGDHFSSPPDAPGLTDHVALLSEQWPIVEGGF